MFFIIVNETFCGSYLSIELYVYQILLFIYVKIKYSIAQNFYFLF